MLCAYVLSDPAGRTDCLLRSCVAMLINARTELLQVSFPANCSKFAKAAHLLHSIASQG